MLFPGSKARPLLLAVCASAAFCSDGFLAAEISVTPGVLVRDQFPWSFTRAAMAGAPRSIVVPLATNLHVAFDVKTLRWHTAWSGSKLALTGYQFGLGANPFAGINGVILWTMPAVCPWQAGERLTNFSTDVSPGSDFRGISTKGGVTTLLYDVAASDGQPVRIHESPRAQWLAGSSVVERRFEVAPGGHPLWLLAHEEAGNGSNLSSNASALVIQRQSNSLVVVIRGTVGGFEVESIPTNSSRVWVRVPPRREAVAFEIASAVCTKELETRQLAPLLAAGLVAPPRMDFITNSTSDAAAAPPVFRSGPQPGRMDGDAFFQREQFSVPKELELLVGGMDWMPNGDLAICTWPGEVYLASNVTGPVTNVTWRRFASGLHEPLGLKVVNGKILIAQKCELTRLVDTDGNGEADLYESVNDDWGFDGNMHYFAYGPALDAQGNYYVTLDGNTAEWNPRWELPFRGWTVKIPPDGRKLEGFSSGLRSPNGCFNYGPDADIFTTDNEGHWLGACKLNHCRPGKFFGYPSSTPMPREVFQKPDGFAPPAVWFPRALSTSASGGTTIPDGCFGPFAGQLLVGDFGSSSILRVALERVNGEWQGAVWPFARGFVSGVNRLAFGPDGKLYVGELRRGWASSGPQESALERLSFSGRAPFEVREVRVRPDGFELTFTEPFDPSSAADPQNWDVSQFNYKFHATYGSPEVNHEGKENSATPIHVDAAQVSGDHRRLRLKLSGWKEGYVTMVRSKTVKSAHGTALWHDTFYYTLNQIPK